MPTLRIAQPCAQSWAAMTPSGPGRHCAACAKTVVDFTRQTDAEILAYFQQASQPKTCGRFRTSQLSRLLALTRPTPRTRWQTWLAGLLVVALATQSCHTTTGEPQPIGSSEPPHILADSVAVGAAPYPTPITGRVVDNYTQQPVQGVRVQLKNTAFTVETDEAGLFAFSDSATPLNATHANPFVLHLTAAGYPACDFTLDYAQPSPNERLQVVPASWPIPEYLMGDVEELK